MSETSKRKLWAAAQHSLVQEILKFVEANSRVNLVGLSADESAQFQKAMTIAARASKAAAQTSAATSTLTDEFYDQLRASAERLREETREARKLVRKLPARRQ
jgi:hypothetical protein